MANGRLNKHTRLNNFLIKPEKERIKELINKYCEFLAAINGLGQIPEAEQTEAMKTAYCELELRKESIAVILSEYNVDLTKFF